MSSPTRYERPCGYMVEVARERSDELDRRIAQMQQARDELRRLLERAEDLPDGDGCYCQLIEHDPAGHEPQAAP